MNEPVVAIIQARMGSTRLPEKVMMDIGDHPMLWHVYERVRRATLVDEVVVATSTEPGDDAVASFCTDEAISHYRGSESDVLDRYYQTAREADAETVVRLTADCPLLSPSVVDRVIRTYERSAAPYVANTIECTYPDGLDVEVFDVAALETAWENADAPAEREHVTPYIRESGEFKTENVRNPVDANRFDCMADGQTLRWTVDYPKDMEFVREVYDRLADDGHWVFDYLSVLELLEREPELLRFNDDR